MKIEYSSIGTIYTPFNKRDGMPIQPAGAGGTEGTIEIHARYQSGLKDLDGFSHIILLYHFHMSEGYNLQPTPFMDTEPRGLFSTRAPKRPNPIGISVVKLVKIQGCKLFVTDVDILDGTPLLDIKPYVPAFDPQGNVRCGWMEKPVKTVMKHRSDSRFM